MNRISLFKNVLLILLINLIFVLRINSVSAISVLPNLSQVPDFTFSGGQYKFDQNGKVIINNLSNGIQLGQDSSFKFFVVLSLLSGNYTITAQAAELPNGVAIKINGLNGVNGMITNQKTAVAMFNGNLIGLLHQTELPVQSAVLMYDDAKKIHTMTRQITVVYGVIEGTLAE